MEHTALYEGKAKIIYPGPDAETLVQFFKDDATAFNAQKKDVISGKGLLNNIISEHVMGVLGDAGITNHFIRRLNDREQLIRRLEIIPVEVVVRNVAAGSICPRLGLTEGAPLPATLVEFCLKDDALGDPVIARECIKCPRKRVGPSPAKHQAQAQDKHILKGISEKRFHLYQGLAHGVAGIGLIGFTVGSRQSAGKHSGA